MRGRMIMVQIDDVHGLVLNALYWDLAVPPPCNLIPKLAQPTR